LSNSFSLKKAFVTSLFSVLVAPCFSQSIFYVDGQTGQDTDTGISLSHAWKTIQKACNAAVPNSVVLIKGGTYAEKLVVNVSGTPGKPIVFTCYGQDSVFVDGTGTAGAALLQISDKNYLEFNHLSFQNLVQNNARGILVETSATGVSTDIAFRKIRVKHICWTANPATLPSATDNAQPFIVYGRDMGLKNLVLDSSEVFDNITGFSEAVSLDGNINGFQVSHCRVHDNTNIGILAAGNYGTSTTPSTDHARNGLIAENVCYRNTSTYATSGGIYVDGGRSIVLERNTCYENGYGIELGCEQNGTTDSIQVRDNLLYANQDVGISVGGYTTATTGQVLNCSIRNNTFFQNNTVSTGSGELTISKASFCVFENNVFYTNSQAVLYNAVAISPQTGNRLNYNCWYTPQHDSSSIQIGWQGVSYTTFASYRAGTSQEVNSLFADPGLLNPVLPSPDLHLPQASVCANRGNPASLIPTNERDFDGQPRVQNNRVDIGAFELGAVSCVTEWRGKGTALRLFPNPCSGSFTLPGIKENALVDLFDEQGVWLKGWTHVSDTYSVMDLLAGVYFIRIQSADAAPQFLKLLRICD
jgi:parallel beta-helix repeat protein